MTEALPPASPTPDAQLMCPKSGEPCGLAELCGPVNAPLADAVLRLATAPDVGPINANPKYAGGTLSAELSELGDSLGANFAPKADFPGITICPSEILQRDLPEGVTKEQVAAGIGTLASKAVDSLALRLRVNRQGYARTKRGVKRRPF